MLSVTWPGIAPFSIRWHLSDWSRTMWAEEADKYWKKADVQRAKKRQFKVSQPPSQPVSSSRQLTKG